MRFTMNASIIQKAIAEESKVNFANYKQFKIFK